MLPLRLVDTLEIIEKYNVQKGCITYTRGSDTISLPLDSFEISTPSGWRNLTVYLKEAALEILLSVASSSVKDKTQVID